MNAAPPTRSDSSAAARSVLVIGATGYVGGRLVPKLLEAGHRVRVLARSPARARPYGWAERVEVVTGDVLDAATLAGAFEDVDVAYHLVHSIGSGTGGSGTGGSGTGGSGTDGSSTGGSGTGSSVPSGSSSGSRRAGFAATDARAAGNVRDAAGHAGLERLVYLGGMGDGDDLSEHLASRQQVGRILASGPTPTTELRAAVIIGSGSLSFEMLRYLTEVLPVMVTPTWVHTRCQPIAIRDVLHYLVAVIDDPEPADRVLDIAGPDVVTYAEMMRAFAEVAGLPRRLVLPVPLLTPRLSSRWVGLVTPLPARVARPLIDSLRHEVVQRDHAIDELVPHEPLDLRVALELALRRTRAEAVDTRWSDAGFTPADTIPGDPDWAGGATYTDDQMVSTTADAAALYGAVARIGGTHGYYVGNWAWSARGLADRLIGGPGLRRGRRHPTELRAGESLDFWRVVRVETGEQLVLQAEMKVPGKAWLTWRIEPRTGSGDGTEGAAALQLRQVAFFAPKGLFGRAYWFVMLPFHWLIFRRMAHAIVDHAERTGRAGRAGRAE